MSSRNLIITIVIILLVALGVWGAIRVSQNSRTETSSNTENNQPANNAPANQPAANTPPATIAGCSREFDQTKLQAAVNIKNQFVTLNIKDYGQIRIQLYDKDAPKTVENFLRLTNSGYYDCLTFHRVAKGFVIQTGDPKGDGTGGESAFGGEFADELNPTAPSYKTGYVKGIVAMANRGPDTNGSQFFITLDDLNANLPKNYTIFGKVMAGLDVIEKIGQVQVTPGPFGAGDGVPVVPVVITEASIVK